MHKEDDSNLEALIKNFKLSSILWDSYTLLYKLPPKNFVEILEWVGNMP